MLPVFPVPVPFGLLLGDAPMLPELPFSLPLLQVSETISTLATLKVFSDPDALPDEELGDIPPAAPPLSHVPFTDTSWPTCADTSCPVKATALPFLVSSTYCPP